MCGGGGELGFYGDQVDQAVENGKWSFTNRAVSKTRW